MSAKVARIQGITDATMWLFMYGSGIVQRDAVVVPAFEMAEVALCKGGSLAVGVFDESGAQAWGRAGRDAPSLGLPQQAVSGPSARSVKVARRLLVG